MFKAMKYQQSNRKKNTTRENTESSYTLKPTYFYFILNFI